MECTLFNLSQKIAQKIAATSTLLFLMCLWPQLGNAADQNVRQVYRVAIDREYEPYEFVDSQGQAQGFTPSLLRAIGEDASVQFEFIPMDWPEAVAALDAGKVDIINMIQSPERMSQYEFSNPHSQISQAIFRQQSIHSIVDLPSLAGHDVSFQKNDISISQLANRTDFKKTIVNTKVEGLLNLNLGKTDAFLCAEQVCIRKIAAYNFQNIALAATNLFPQDFAFAAHKRNQQVIELLNVHLARIKASGQLQALDAKWLQGSLVQKNWVIQNWIKLSVVFFIILALIWNISLRMSVRARTKKLNETAAQLARSVSLLQATLESTNDAILVVDLNNAWLLHNQQFIDLWHITDEIIAARDDLAALSYVLNQLEDPDGFLKKVNELYATPEASSFDTLKFRDGKIIERYSIPQRIDGKVTGRVWSFRDVTERNQAALRDKALVRRIQVLMQSTTEGIHILDDQGNVIEANDAFARHLGYTKAEILQRSVFDFEAKLTADEVRINIKNLLDGGHATFESVHRRKDGTLVDVEVIISGVALDEQKSLFCLSRDITERKKVEHVISESIRKLEEKELSKSRFFAAAGHDLRQPLAAANLFLDALKFTELTPKQDKIIQRLAQAMSILGGLLDSLLNISKLDSGAIKPEYAPINVTGVFNRLEQNFAPLASEKQIGFKLYFPMRETLAVCSDIGLLNSILMNLVSNAIKYTSKGAILISARKRGSEVLFQVWDTGIGIADEHIEHIFDEFYQINNPQRDRTGGLGLGLAIAKRAITLLSGEITCRSQIGRGSVFEFRLPLYDISRGMVQQAAIGASQEDAIDLSFAQGKFFVVVEDDMMVAQALTQSLEGLGGEVERFHSAEDALHHVNIGYADCYIVDYMLGGALNGIQFLNTLRQKLDKPVNAVLLTGDTSTAFIRDAADFDWPVLYKPVNTANLISTLSAQEESMFERPLSGNANSGNGSNG